MSEKRYAAVICEYNPFHFGHERQIRELSEEGYRTVCILGGELTQRGGIALADKYLRAECALEAGACLVLELPIPFCCASAHDFARAGVSAAARLGIPYLAFGTEDGRETAEELFSAVSEPDFASEVTRRIKEKKNLSYPKAQASVISEKLGRPVTELSAKPNNILALEYMLALSEWEGISPLILRRDMALASAGEIRALRTRKAMLEMLPECSKRVLGSKESAFPREGERLDPFFIGALRNGIGDGNVYGMTADLFSRIAKEANRAAGVDELCALCADAKYTRARVRRGINSLVFGFSKESVVSPQYLTLLACDGDGRDLLAENRRRKGINILTKPAKALSLPDEAKRQFLLSLRVERIISLASPTPVPDPTERSPLIKDRRKV